MAWRPRRRVFRVALQGMMLTGFASAMVLARFSTTQTFAQTPAPWVVPKATCGPNDHPETALQGQVPAALRATGFHGFNCNLELLSQSKGDGANWQSTEYRDAIGKGGGQGKGVGHPGGTVCAYHGSASPERSLPTRNPATYGVPVIDITDTSNPVRIGYLQTSSMLDPWE